MFDTAILDTLETAPQSRRWSTVASFSLQVFAIGVLLVAPLIYTEGLPQLRFTERLSVPTAPPAERVVEIVSSETQRQTPRSEFVNGRLMEPQSIPRTTTTVVDPPTFNASSNQNVSTVPFTIVGSNSASFVNDLIATTHEPPAARVELRREPLRLSVLSEAMLIQKVQPVYPPIARSIHLQGPVQIVAVIDTSGRINSLRLVSGHPMLVNAAMDAVKQWRYRPYILNGQPIEVETQITVVFTLQ